MKKRALASLVLSLALAGAAGAAPASASDRERNFFQTVEGQWSGPGEIVDGKYKGTKFVCNFTGSTAEPKIGMSLDGSCRVGLFSQKMSATVEKAVGKGFRGAFLDGAKGKGLDVTGGQVTGDKVVLALNRKALNGVMLARLADENTMNITVSVKYEGDLLPMIGISLKRLDKIAVSSLGD